MSPTPRMAHLSNTAALDKWSPDKRDVIMTVTQWHTETERSQRATCTSLTMARRLIGARSIEGRPKTLSVIAYTRLVELPDPAMPTSYANLNRARLRCTSPTRTSLTQVASYDGSNL